MLLRYLGAFALAFAMFITMPAGAARAAGYPLVTGKCGCAIGWGIHIADCGSSRVTCTRAMCARACEAKLPKKTSNLQVTDVSSARRMRRGGPPVERHAGVRGEQRRGYASRDRGGARPAARVDIAGASQTDRDGRGYAPAPAGVSAPIREVTHRRVRGLAAAAIQGATIGGHAGGVTRVCAGSSCGTVASWAAEKFQGLFADLAALGYSLGSPGCLSGGHMRHSLHHTGMACDLFDQYARNKTHLPQPPPAVQIELAAKHGLTAGASWCDPDGGHFDLSGYNGCHSSRRIHISRK